MTTPAIRTPIRPGRGLYANLAASVADLEDGELVYATDTKLHYTKTGGVLVAVEAPVVATFIDQGFNIVYVSKKEDLPAPVSGVINLSVNTTYFILGDVDLAGSRLSVPLGVSIIGGSSSTCVLRSTGLTSQALISCIHGVQLRHIGIEAAIGLNLDASITPNQSLSWYDVVFTNTPVVGTVKGYQTFILGSGAFINSGGFTFDGSINTIAFTDCNFVGASNLDQIIFATGLAVSKRFRLITSAVTVIGATATALKVANSASFGVEGFVILDSNFTLVAGATALSGLGTIASSNTVYINGCRGIENTAVNGQMYMNDNATSTAIAATNTFVKVAGTTTASADNAKYTHTNNRLTCAAAISRKYLIQCSLSFTTGVNNVCQFGFYDSKLGAVRTPSRTKSTASATGRAESVTFMCVVSHISGDYIEIWAANTTAATAIVVTDMNVVITEL